MIYQCRMSPRRRFTSYRLPLERLCDSLADWVSTKLQTVGSEFNLFFPISREILSTLTFIDDAAAFPNFYSPPVASQANQYPCTEHSTAPFDIPCWHQHQRRAHTKRNERRRKWISIPPFASIAISVGCCHHHRNIVEPNLLEPQYMLTSALPVYA